MDRMFTTFRTASEGMDLQRQKVQTASENIANVNTTQTADGEGAYRPKIVESHQGERQEFQRMLQDTLMDLRQTRGEHIESPDFQKSPDGTRNFGPNSEVVEQDKFRYEHDPEHPDADENGMVRYPDLDLSEEMTRLISANRMYEANMSAVQAEKEIITRSFEI